MLNASIRDPGWRRESVSNFSTKTTGDRNGEIQVTDFDRLGSDDVGRLGMQLQLQHGQDRGRETDSRQRRDARDYQLRSRPGDVLLHRQLANAPEDTKLKATWTAVEVAGEQPNCAD